MYKPRIMISGETGGTGASTTGKLICSTLNLPFISGGKYMRALAHNFNIYKKANAGKNPTQIYNDFLQIYEETFRNFGLDKTNEIFKNELTLPHQSDILAEYQAAIEENQSKTGKTDAIWDYIVDQNTVKEALELDGFIWEAKLAVIALRIDQLQPAINASIQNDNPIIHVLLTLNHDKAAGRVAQREHRPVTVNEIETRRNRDFDRYNNIYTIEGKSVMHSDLHRFADIIIDTEKLNPKQVVTQILTTYKEIIQKKNTLDYNNEIIQQIDQAIESLKIQENIV